MGNVIGLIGLIFFLCIFIYPYTLCLIDKLYGTIYSCKQFGWHNGKGKSDGVSFDGCSVHAKCSKCGKEVMKDSQGNWF